ncbi:MULTISPECIES: carboxylate-amine ligase [Methylobacterium]|uniref:Putative glutamate--cysteine ligase 2 n=1 Tax=Methylobacterium jeotgali TaxID=381630 RepID=A0ABQ4SNY2_9HYPH|nr:MULTISPECIES: carboxylate-amine ligase [Methylobacterium]PIU06428.1 MAG: carboxylate-amine ligase [Methylobacterium sp. CG09_land_8_20_14_0_10_71_15]PIU15828.1 MAG: carboxylate-amine ligase [Methylobacterium sp. CG08_land_8_20_14_0_20_71_15]GBU18354.1 putative glutamate--cysteine ligase 2 [Methylobacterium sp.]GJE04931.1 Putative glutamate--cysteine ligase 2 [Methylobacterium jeotgali]
MSSAPYRFGIEEEYFLADAETRGTPRRSVKPFHVEAAETLPEIGRELLQCQVEVCTPPVTAFAQARDVLGRQRRALADLGRAHGLLVFAAGTHPVADWARQLPTKGDRYRGILKDVGLAGRRSLICGMHVHVEVPDPEARVDLMNRLLPFQPLLFALSASSPFWQGKPTGLTAYRLSAFGELPRTGLPPLFRNAEAYARYVRIMTRAGSIQDASFLWWSLRPSIKFPTLELRIADSCTRLEDALTIAALFRSLVRLAVRRPDLNAGLDDASRALAEENLWRAQRSGIDAEMIEERDEEAHPFAESLERLLALVAEDADALGCTAEVERARTILSDGTSADRQIGIYEKFRETDGNSNRQALDAVVDWLAETSAA